MSQSGGQSKSRAQKLLILARLPQDNRRRLQRRRLLLFYLLLFHLSIRPITAVIIATIRVDSTISSTFSIRRSPCSTLVSRDRMPLSSTNMRSSNMLNRFTRPSPSPQVTTHSFAVVVFSSSTALTSLTNCWLRESSLARASARWLFDSIAHPFTETNWRHRACREWEPPTQPEGQGYLPSIPGRCHTPPARPRRTRHGKAI